MIYTWRTAGALSLLAALAGCVSEPGEFGRRELTTFYEQEVAAGNTRLVREIGRLDSCIEDLDIDLPDTREGASLTLERPKACAAARPDLGPNAYFLRALQPVLASYRQSATRAVRGGRGDGAYVKVAKLVEDHESLKELYLIRFAQAQVYARRLESLEYLMAKRGGGEVAPVPGPQEEGTGNPVPRSSFQDWDDRED